MRSVRFLVSMIWVSALASWGVADRAAADLPVAHPKDVVRAVVHWEVRGFTGIDPRPRFSAPGTARCHGTKLGTAGSSSEPRD